MYMRLICQTLRANNEDNDVGGYCCIDPTPQLLDLIERRYELVKQAHQQDPAVSNISFDDWWPWHSVV